MAKLADPARRPAPSRLYRLSDLSLQEARDFEEHWPKLGVACRRQLIRQLMVEVEAKVELNFDRVFKACLKDPDESVRAKAIEGLWECHDPSLIVTLLTLLHEDPAQSVRVASAKALGVFVLLAELGKLRPHYEAQLREALLREIENNRQPLDVRQQVVESIAYFSHAEVSEIIKKAYRSTEPQMQIGAIRAMGRNLDSKWLGVLLLELSNSEVEWRLAATIACGELGDEKAVPHLIKRLEDEDSQVQLTAIQALGQLGNKDVIKALNNMLNHPRPTLRKAAREALQEALLSDAPISIV